MAERSPINTPLGRLNTQADTIAVRVGRLMVFVVLIVTVYFILQEYGVLTAITETEKLKSWIADNFRGYNNILRRISFQAFEKKMRDKTRLFPCP